MADTPATPTTGTAPTSGGGTTTTPTAPAAGTATPGGEQTPTTPKVEPKPPLSPRLAKAMETEAKLQREREAIAKEKAELEAQKKERAEIEALKDKDLAAYAERLGISYEKLTEAVLGQKKPSAEMEALEAEKKARSELEKRLKDIEQQREQERKQSAEQWEREWLARGQAEVKANAKDFALLIAEPQGFDLVHEYVEAYATKHRKLPEGGFLGAAKLVQEHLKAEALQKAKVLQSPEVRAILGLSSNEPAAPPAKSESGQNTSPRTLTNELASALPPPDELTRLSTPERIDRAAQFLRNSRK